MKLKLALCALTVGGSLFLAAQQPATSPSTSTPPTFPSDQKAPAPDQARPDVNSQSTGAQSGQVDQSQTGAQSGSMDNSKSIEGCLSQAPSGSGFILTDSSGVQYTLQGDNSDLSSHVGQQVKISGDLAANSAAKDNSSASASSAGAAGSEAGANSITVKKVKKVASSCSASQAQPPSK